MEEIEQRRRGLGDEGLSYELGTLFGACVRMLADAETVEEDNRFSIERVTLWGAEAAIVYDGQHVAIKVDEDLDPMRALAAVLRVVEEHCISRDVQFRWGSFHRAGLSFEPAL